MKDALNNGLIKAMREHLPEDTNLANYIMDIISIGKEAVYRRLRGEVPFTFYEVSLLSQSLGLSLDQIVGTNRSEGAIFNLNVSNGTNQMDKYHDILKRYSKLFNFVKDDPNAVLSAACNIVPFTFYSPYERLTKFRLCRWMHQNNGMKITAGMSDIIVPEKILESQRRLMQETRLLPNSYTILDNNVFQALVREIKYFAGLNMLTDEDIEVMKQELHHLLDEMEQIAAKGEYPNGNKVYLYLSNINFEATYTFLEKGTFQLCMFRLYAINYMDSQHPEICRAQKEWIQSLKRYSTLISQSGEIQRMIFFTKQREIVDTL
ncbi:hypothetical protein [Parabacteroides sp.]